jgi:hypothetical protein
VVDRISRARAGGVSAGLVFIASAVMPNPAAAAICACTDENVGRNAGNADAVFSATITSAKVETAGSGEKARQILVYAAKVERVYQGSVSAQRVQITTTAEKRRCGVGELPTGTSWMLFVNGADATFVGNTCGGSARLTDKYRARVEDTLGDGALPEPEPAVIPSLAVTKVEQAAPWPLARLIAPGAGLTIIGLLGLGLISRRPRQRK